ncbi:MAG: hypothetical protein IT234_03520, partial [Bacteroidia bacterium]|nr:hypothetical protein [Bacteroidia bacterium]
MKKYSLFIIAFLLTIVANAQNNELKTQFGCYGNNDSLTIKAIEKTKAIQILGNGNANINVKSWELAIQVKKGKIYTFKANSSLITDRIREELIRNFKRAEKVMIQNVNVSVFNKKTQQYEDQVAPTTTLYMNDKAKKKCDEKTSQAKDDLVLKFSCYKSGESASVKEILRYPTFTIINSNPQVDIKILS